MSKIWRLRLADQVELDLRDIVTWTADHFGPRQADDYLETVTRAIEALHDGPAIVGVQDRNDIGPGMRTLHVARLGRRGRHFIVFRAADQQTIDILRLLHDSMDLVRHLPLSEDRP